MSEEIREIVEVLNLFGNFTARLSGEAIKGMSFLAKLFYSKYWDQRGKQDFDYVMKACEKRGCGLEFMDVATEDISTIHRIEEKLKEVNVQFALLPDLCQGDGYTQFAMPADQVGVFAKVMETEIDVECKQIGPEDYEKTASSELKEELKKEARENVLSTESIDNAKISNLKKEYEDTNFSIVSLNKDRLLVKQTDEEKMFYIPGSNRKQIIPISNKDVVSENNKTIWVKLDKTHDYQIADLENDNPPKVNGKELLNKFSDPFNYHDKNKGSREPQPQHNREKSKPIKPERKR